MLVLLASEPQKGQGAVECIYYPSPGEVEADLRSMLARLLSQIDELQAERESLPKKPLSSTHMCMFTNPQTWTHVCLSQSQGWVHKATVQRALWLARLSIYFQWGVGSRVFTMGARMGQKGVFVVGASPATPNTTRPGDSNDSITLGGLTSSHALWPEHLRGHIDPSFSRAPGTCCAVCSLIHSFTHSSIHSFLSF